MDQPEPFRRRRRPPTIGATAIPIGSPACTAHAAAARSARSAWCAAPVGHQCPNCVAEARREFRRGPGRRVAIANAKRVSVTNVLVAIMRRGLRDRGVRRAASAALIGGPNAEHARSRLGARRTPCWSPSARPGGCSPRCSCTSASDPPRGQRLLAVHPRQRAGTRGRPGAVPGALPAVRPVRQRGFLLLQPAQLGERRRLGRDLRHLRRGVRDQLPSTRTRPQGAMAMRAMVQIIVLNVIINVVLSRYLDWRAHLGGFDRRDGRSGLAFAAPGRDRTAALRSPSRERCIALGSSPSTVVCADRSDPRRCPGSVWTPCRATRPRRGSAMPNRYPSRVPR